MASKKKAMGRPRKADQWVIRSFNLTTSEAAIYDKLKGEESGREFVMRLLRLEKRERLKCWGAGGHAIFLSNTVQRASHASEQSEDRCAEEGVPTVSDMGSTTTV